MEAFFQFVVLILAVMAGFIVVKYVSTYLPDGGFFGAFKAVLQAA